MPRPELVVSIGKARAAESTSVRDAVLVYLDSLYRFALRLTGNIDQARDLTHDALLRAFERQFTGLREPRAWLFQTLYHIFVDHYRRSSRETSQHNIGESDQEEEVGIVNPVPAFMAAEDVQNALESLPEEFRGVVWLSDAEEFRLQEIAEILGCPLGTVASRLARGRRELRQALAVYGREQEK